MKTFVMGVLLGIIVGGGAVWYFAVGRNTPAVQQAEERAADQAQEAMESAGAAAEKARQALNGLT